MLKFLYKNRISALFVYCIAELVMILVPDNLYVSGSLFLLGHCILLLPYIGLKIDEDIMPYLLSFIIACSYMVVYNKDCKSSFVVCFGVYLFILMLLAYKTRNESYLFKHSTHLLFISDILLGINVICIQGQYLIPIYGGLFFIGIFLLILHLIKGYNIYDKVLI